MPGKRTSVPFLPLDTRALLAGYTTLQKVMIYLTGISVLAMSILLVANIMLRFTDFTILWVAGTAQLLLVYIVFLPLGFLELEDRHIQVNYFYNKAPDILQSALDYAIRILGLAVIALTTVSSVQAYQLFGGRESAYGIPTSLVFIPGIVGMGLLTIEYFRRLLADIERDLW
jgi:TRAP-type C4-dicarboxylate transport system permease small subunit